MKRRKIILNVTIIIFFALQGSLMGQEKSTPQTLLWQINDPCSKHVSYLFGTDHIWGASWLDSITMVKDKFLQSKHVFVEMGNAKLDTTLIDSLKKPYKGPAVIPAKIFKRNYYSLVTNYVKSIGWGNLDTVFYGNPQPILMLWALDWQLTSDYAAQLHVISPDEDNIDNYFAKQAIAAGKTLTNLDDSITIFTNLASKQDPKILAKRIGKHVAFLQGKNGSIPQEFDISFDYINLKCRYHLNKKAPKSVEKGGLDLTIRNNQWMLKLNKALREGDCFIGVGFGHLDFKEGLINQLRKAGFEVSPVPMERIKN